MADGGFSARQVEPAGAGSRRYSAFISYSHADEEIAGWLHRRLESYRIPASLAPRGRRKLGKLFRDRVELSAAHDLGGEIRKALDASDALILLCSPRAARSQYVAEEIRHFKHLGRSKKIFAVIVSGEPHAAGKPGRSAEEECFPAALLYRLDEEGRLSSTPEDNEPIAADVREGRDGRESSALKIVAGLLGVGLDDLVQREKQAERSRRLRIQLIAAGFAVLAAGAAVAGGVALWQRGEAVRNRELADAKTVEAEASAREATRNANLARDSESKALTAAELAENNARDASIKLAAAFAAEGEKRLSTDPFDSARWAIAGLVVSEGRSEESRDMLRRARHDLRPYGRLTTPEGGELETLVVSDDGTIAAGCSNRKDLVFHTLATSKLTTRISTKLCAQPSRYQFQFSRDNSRFIAANSNEALVFSVANRKQEGRISWQDYETFDRTFSYDGSRVFARSRKDGGLLVLRDTSDGRVVGSWRQPNINWKIVVAGEAPLAVVYGEAQPKAENMVIDVRDGSVARRLPPIAQFISLSPLGERVATVSVMSEPGEEGVYTLMAYSVKDASRDSVIARAAGPARLDHFLRTYGGVFFDERRFAWLDSQEPDSAAFHAVDVVTGERLADAEEKRLTTIPGLMHRVGDAVTVVGWQSNYWWSGEDDRVDQHDCGNVSRVIDSGNGDIAVTGNGCLMDGPANPLYATADTLSYQAEGHVAWRLRQGTLISRIMEPPVVMAARVEMRTPSVAGFYVSTALQAKRSEGLKRLNEAFFYRADLSTAQQVAGALDEGAAKAAYSADGSRICESVKRGNGAGDLIVRETATHKVIFSKTYPSGAPLCLLSASGDRLVATGQEREFWDVDSKTMLRRLEAYGDVVFTKDGRYLLHTTLADGKLKLAVFAARGAKWWEVLSDTRFDLVLAPRGSQVGLSRSWAGFEILDLAQRKRILIRGDGRMLKALLPDEEHYVAADLGSGAILRVGSIASEVDVRSFSSGVGPASVVSHPDGVRLLAFGGDGYAVIDWRSGRVLATHSKKAWGNKTTDLSGLNLSDIKGVEFDRSGTRFAGILENSAHLYGDDIRSTSMDMGALVADVCGVSLHGREARFYVNDLAEAPLLRDVWAKRSLQMQDVCVAGLDLVEKMRSPSSIP